MSHSGLTFPPVASNMPRRRHEDEEAQADEEQAVGELGRAGRLARAEPHPQRGEHGGEEDDEQRLHGLEPARGEAPAEERRAGRAVGEQVEARPRLLEAGPEQAREHEQGHDRAARACARCPGRPGGRATRRTPPRRRGRARACSRTAGRGPARWRRGRPPRCPRAWPRSPGAPRSSPAPRSRSRPSTNCTRPRVIPTPAAPKPQCQPTFCPRYPHTSGRDEGAEVDPHVEDREAAVAARVVRAVELADDGGDVRLQEPGAEHDQHEPGEEQRPHVQRHAVVAEGDEDAAHDHGAAQAQQAVRDPAAGDRREVHREGVEPVDGGRALRRPSPARPWPWGPP